MSYAWLFTDRSQTFVRSVGNRTVLCTLCITRYTSSKSVSKTDTWWCMCTVSVCGVTVVVVLFLDLCVELLVLLDLLVLFALLCCCVLTC